MKKGDSKFFAIVAVVFFLVWFATRGSVQGFKSGKPATAPSKAALLTKLNALNAIINAYTADPAEWRWHMIDQQYKEFVVMMNKYMDSPESKNDPEAKRPPTPADMMAQYQKGLDDYNSKLISYKDHLYNGEVSEEDYKFILASYSIVGVAAIFAGIPIGQLPARPSPPKKRGGKGFSGSGLQQGSSGSGKQSRSGTLSSIINNLTL